MHKQYAFKCICIYLITWNFCDTLILRKNHEISVKPLWSRHPQDFPSVRLIEGVCLKPRKTFFGLFRNCLNCDSLRWSHIHFIKKGLLTINIERFLFAVIKFQVVNQPILNSSSLPTSMFLLTYHYSIDSFKDYSNAALKFSPVSA